MQVRNRSGLCITRRVKLSFLFKFFQCYMLLPFMVFASVPVLTWSTAAHATVPDASGSYTGTINETEVCPTPSSTNTESFSASFTITQSGTTINGSGTTEESTFEFQGTIDANGEASGTLNVQEDNPPSGQTGQLTGGFDAFLSGNTLNFSYQISDVGPPDCTLTGNGTFTRASGGAAVITEETPSSIVATPILLNTQVKAITGDLNSRIGDVLRGIAIGPRRTATGFMWQGHSSGLNAGDSITGFGIWGSYSYSDFENDFVSTAFDGHRHNFLTGFDIAPWENTVAGIALGYESSDIDTGFNRGNQETDGFTIAPYFGYLLTDNFSIDASFGYSGIDSDQFRTDPGTSARVTSAPDADRYFGAVNLNGFTMYENWIFSGRLGFLHARNVTDAFTESDGTLIQEFESKLSQFNIGGEAAYGLGAFEPFARVGYEYDFSQTELTALAGPQPSNDDDNFLFGAGVRFFGTSGLTGNFEWNKRVGREDFDEDVFTATLRMDF